MGWSNRGEGRQATAPDRASQSISIRSRQRCIIWERGCRGSVIDTEPPFYSALGTANCQPMSASSPDCSSPHLATRTPDRQQHTSPVRCYCSCWRMPTYQVSVFGLQEPRCRWPCVPGPQCIIPPLALSPLLSRSVQDLLGVLLGNLASLSSARANIQPCRCR